MAGLMRQTTHVLWNATSVVAGGSTITVDTRRIQFIGVFVRSSAPTTINLEIQTISGWARFDSITFTVAGDQWWNIWAFPFSNIRFTSSAAAIITLEVSIKT